MAKRPSKAALKRDLRIEEEAHRIGLLEGEARAHELQERATERHHLRQFYEQIIGCNLSSSLVLIGAEVEGDKTKMLSVPLAQLRLIAKVVKRDLLGHDADYFTMQPR